MRSALGVLAAAVAMHAWGFAYWGASSAPYFAWSQSPDDRAAGQALLEHFPESGVYYLPANGNPPELRAELYESGPVGFVFIDRDGRPEFDPGIMVRGFLLNVVVVALLPWLFRIAAPALRTHGQRLRLTALVGLIFVAMVHLGDVVWWVLPLDWELAQAFYNLSAIVIGAAVLTRFSDPSAGEATPA